MGFNGEFGFAPANYIEISSSAEVEQPPSLPTRPAQPAAEEEEAAQHDVEEESTPTEAETSASPNPAANLASIIQNQAPSAATAPTRTRHVQFTPEPSEDEGPPPSLPQRPISRQIEESVVREPTPPSLPSPPPQSFSPPRPEYSGVLASPPENRIARSRSDVEGAPPSPGGYHLYNINEMVSVMGKQKKMPTTLGINLATGVILIIPEKKRDGPQQEWTADKLTHYSIEGKHVFMELVKPSRSIDFHAGAKDTATEIVSSLGDLAGMARAEGLREVIAAGNGQKQRKGYMLYEFMAQGDDEVTVAEGDQVILLDDQQSEEWWKVRRIKNGKEGVVPSSYVELTEVASPPPPGMVGVNAGRSTIEQNRQEEERVTMEVMQASQKREQKEKKKSSEVGPGLKLPNRGSSLLTKSDTNPSSSQRSKRESRAESKSASKSSMRPSFFNHSTAKKSTEPDMTKIRTWTDRSGSFTVDAQFIGLKDGKIHLHKLNGVKIAVPVARMAVEDLEYVERAAGVSLDEDKPVSEIIKRAHSRKESDSKNRKAADTSGARKQELPKKPEYDWFDFFLKCGVSPYQCERYSHAFNKDSMDENVLEEITPGVLRNIGLKEGDVLRVMKYLDNKYSRTGAKSKLRNVSFGGEHVIGDEGAEDGAGPQSSGLFSGPGGTLKNNTRKGRPAPPIQTNDVVDSKLLQQKSPRFDLDKDTPQSPEDPPEPPEKDKKSGGFEDNAWDVKPSKPASQPSQPRIASASSTPTAASAPGPAKPTLTGAMRELSLLDEPLQPVVTHPGGQSQPQTQAPQPQVPLQPTATQVQIPQVQSQQTQMQSQPQQQQVQQPQGATPSFFNQLNQQPTGLPQQQLPNSSIPQIISQQTGQFQPNVMPPRQRPQAPQIPPQQGSIMPPPPARPLSAPQNPSQPSTFGPPPLQPQLTGVINPSFQNTLTSPTQTLNDLQRMRVQQQISPPPQQQSQFTGFPQGQPFGIQPNGPPQHNNFNQPQFQTQAQIGLQPQVTGVPQAPFLMGQQTGSPFADPRGSQQPLQSQFTGFQPNTSQLPGPFPNQIQPQLTGSINSVLSPPLQPQGTGLNGYGFGSQQQQQQAPPVPQIPQQFSPPPIPQQPTMAPLQPQKTGPAPAIKFGIGNEAKKLLAQPTSKRANLSQASESLFHFRCNGNDTDRLLHSSGQPLRVLMLIVMLCHSTSS